ncbi:putative cytidine deaminase [Magnetofaba australis IT-1]|uniref:Putative cytidine deaminase n=2 Tax=Magnetofaba TaxID=1472292 RepID=A0A1Y2JZ61_9PROT|nr:putative cytidine deaminase [Magnetofaba australis IT-1]
MEHVEDDPLRAFLTKTMQDIGGAKLPDYLPASEIKRLLAEAWWARGFAHAPYSDYAVGAALLDENTGIHSGCNVENASLGLSMCAERVALFKGVCDGERHYLALSLVAEADAEGQPIAPCGACLQTLGEFLQPETTVFLASVAGALRVTTFGALFPKPFRLDPKGA